MNSAAPFRLLRGAGLLLTGILMLVTVAPAATVADLYSAEVELPPDGGIDAAFDAALDQVLVKVTGQSVPLGPESRALFDDAGSLVRQYRNTAPGRLQVGFDPVALRRLLDAAGLPTWDAERPSVLVWLAMDMGRGQREILPAEQAAPDEGLPGMLPAAAAEGPDLEPLREQLLDTAARRGLPVILPLVDSVDLEALTFADLWGDFSAPVLEASARYQPDAVLIGRLRGPDPATGRVRWTLLAGEERMDWEGDLNAGPAGTADRLAARLASRAGASRLIRLQVSGVATLEAYGTVFNYLDGLGIVDACRVDRVAGDRVLFGLLVRGDPDRLMRSIALRPLLRPVAVSADPWSADLHYALNES